MEATTAERSASGGPGGEPEAGNLAKAFQASAERLGDATALRQGDRTVSWNELRAEARAVAGACEAGRRQGRHRRVHAQ